MARTWSNRKITHIDLNAGKGKPLPFAVWALMGFGLVFFSYIIFIAVWITTHPVQTEMHGQSISITQRSPLSGIDLGH